MADAQLIKRWKATEAVLEGAYSALPAPPESVRPAFAAAVAEYRHFVEHNELGLALDSLVAAAELVAARGGVWRDLERAAHFMKLDERAADLHARFVRAATDAEA